MPQAVTQQTVKETDDRLILAELASADRPVLLFFYQQHDEASEFNALVVDAVARARGDGMMTLAMSKQANPVTDQRFSLPDGPVFMLVRNNTILGYKNGKVSQASLEAWVDTAMTRPDADGVPIESFLQDIEKKQKRQADTSAAGVRRARLYSMAGAAIRTAGGLTLASSFAVPGLGLAGIAIAGYAAFRGFLVMLDPEKRRPLPPQSLAGKVIDTAMNAATWAGSFGLLALAFNTMAGVAFYGVAATALVMMGHSSMGLGRLLPQGLLIGSLRRDADLMAQRDPTKPLDEFSPPAPQPEFEVAPQNEHSAQDDFSGAAKNKTAATSKPADVPAQGRQPTPPQP